MTEPSTAPAGRVPGESSAQTEAVGAAPGSAEDGPWTAGEDAADVPATGSAQAPVGSEPGGAAESGLLEREGDIAADFLEGLLDIADLDGDLDMDVEGTRASVSIVGTSLDALVGPNGTALEALQGLTRLAVTRETGLRSRLMLDVAGFRAGRRAEVTETARDAVRQVAATSQPQPLAPMTAFERKIVHDVVAECDGVVTESEGEEPDRHVVLRPA